MNKKFFEIINFVKFFKDKKIYILIVQSELFSKYCIFFNFVLFLNMEKAKKSTFY